jgi:hypothetical protein
LFGLSAVATNGLTHGLAKLFQGVRLGEHGSAHGTSRKPALWGLFNKEHDFSHGVSKVDSEYPVVAEKS